VWQVDKQVLRTFSSPCFDVKTVITTDPGAESVFASPIPLPPKPSPPFQSENLPRNMTFPFLFPLASLQCWNVFSQTFWIFFLMKRSLILQFKIIVGALLGGDKKGYLSFFVSHL
jgi:hypothetical protein